MQQYLCVLLGGTGSGKATEIKKNNRRSILALFLSQSKCIHASHAYMFHSTTMSLKAQKEAFVTGHSGTRASEILLVCVSAPIGLFLYCELRNYFERRRPLSKNAYLGMKVNLESLTILLPMTICQTVFLYPFGVLIMFFELLIAVILHQYRIQNERTYSLNKATKENIRNAEEATTKKLHFLTFYRSTISYLTFIAILAVDFQVFPRKFAKTETYGYGLMDLGAGSFCVSGGFVSWFARRMEDDGRRFHNVLAHSIPLLIMGFLRLFTTKGLEYQEHVSEYGVHWNFFFTLFIVGLLSTYVRSVLSIKNPMWWILILLSYQYLLTSRNNGVQEYVENAPRQCKFSDREGENIILSSQLYFCNLFAANREGILGCIGYLVLHLASEDIAYFCLWGCKHRTRTQGIRLGLISAVFWIVHCIFVSWLEIPVSRRSTNAAFVVWTIAHNVTILFCICMVFAVAGTSRQSSNRDFYGENPPIFSAVNQHSLLIFILANLMTGFVNLSMDTLNATHAQAISVIFLYLCAVGVVALVLEWRLGKRTKSNIKII